MANGGAEGEGGKKTGVWERLLAGINSVVNLRVITFVGEVTVSGTECKPQVSLGGGGSKAMVTCQNLVDGDIVNAFSKEYESENYSWLRDYHAEQVKQARDVVKNNIELIGKLGKEVIEAVEKICAFEKKEKA
jgi:hypothetical protein